ncbi:MAG: PhoU domain-containing protein, partial [Clostridia bacterium]|nr:PhoU domain-containing protein [Clostridia bacterium]
TDKLKDNFYSNHYERVIKEQCSTKMTPYISTLIIELERIADHLTNIGYSIVNPVGAEQNKE